MFELRKNNTMKQHEHWLNRKRLTIYPRMVLAFFLAAGFFWFLLSNGMVSPTGKSLDYDFLTIWAASHLGLSGRPQDAYDLASLSQVIRIEAPASQSIHAWLYPLPFYLIALPLALLPYLPSYLVFMLTTLTGYVVVLRRIISSREAMWCLAGFSGLWINLFNGQNAFLTAALVGAGLLNLERRPVLAGIFIGLLAIKPQLALLFPVVLIAIGAWSAFFTALFVALAFTAISILVLGIPTFEAWGHSFELAKRILEYGDPDILAKRPTTLAALQLLGFPLIVGYISQLIVAVFTTAVVWKTWRYCSSWALRGAALTVGTLLVTPYLHYYDLALLALPIAWLVQIGLREGWLSGEREVLVLAWLLPLMVVVIPVLIPIQIGPLVLLAMLWAIMRRVNLHGLTSSC